MEKQTEMKGQGRTERGKRTSSQTPELVTERAYTFPAFADGKVLPGKKCGRLHKSLRFP